MRKLVERTGEPNAIQSKSDYAYDLERITCSGFGGSGGLTSSFPCLVCLVSGICSRAGVVEAAEYLGKCWCIVSHSSRVCKGRSFAASALVTTWRASCDTRLGYFGAIEGFPNLLSAGNLTTSIMPLGLTMIGSAGGKWSKCALGLYLRRCWTCITQRSSLSVRLASARYTS